jgi:tetratricopeptide (TPR) repeat protein
METRISYLFVAVIALCLSCAYTYAQERSLVRKGNELYMQKKYPEAAKAYQEALQKQPTFTPGAFNLGNALVQQKQFEAARKVMSNAVKTSRDPMVQSGAHYNSGNTYMSEQQWQQAVDAYKQSLRKNPQDVDAKYNLSYALEKLKQQQQQGGGGGGDKDKNKDNKDGKDQDQKDQQKDGKNKQEQQNQGDQDEQHQKQRPQPQQSKISEQQADNLLKALQQDERKVQDKMQQGKATPIRLEKDW